jgi:lysophospholipase L1-like esterase
MGANLQLLRHNASVFWQGKGGMKWNQVYPQVQTLLKIEGPPDYLMIHCGGNDIGQGVKCVVLRNQIKKGISKLLDLLPNTIIIWSQILPRLHWRGELDHAAVDRARLRLNSCIATFILKFGGKYVSYPELKTPCPELFKDSVHLNSLGNCLFLHRIQEALQCFLIKPTVTVVPQAGGVCYWLP